VGTGELPLEKWFWILAREVGVGAMLALTTRLQAESAPGKSREATPENNRIPSWVILGFPDFVTAWMRASGNGFSQCLRQEASDMLLDNLPRDLSDLVFSSVTFFAAIRDYRLFEDHTIFFSLFATKAMTGCFARPAGFVFLAAMIRLMWRSRRYPLSLMLCDSLTMEDSCPRDRSFIDISFMTGSITAVMMCSASLRKKYLSRACLSVGQAARCSLPDPS
jgi:hypothetical protein